MLGAGVDVGNAGLGLIGSDEGVALDGNPAVGAVGDGVFGHHFQIATHRDNARHITYDYVVVDDKKTDWKDETVVAAERLGWTPGDLVPNFQLDGVGSGIMTVYYDKMHVWRW